jgi:hypothetical protein
MLNGMGFHQEIASLYSFTDGFKVHPSFLTNSLCKIVATFQGVSESQTLLSWIHKLAMFVSYNFNMNHKPQPRDGQIVSLQAYRWPPFPSEANERVTFSAASYYKVQPDNLCGRRPYAHRQ